MTDDRPLKLAYADPPYLGCCGLYDHHHEEPWGCWDDVEVHKRLIAHLCDEYPDGWALSASSSSLQRLLPLCPEDVRIAAWAKSFCAFKRGVRPCYSWEPVIFRGGRNPSNGYPHRPPAKGGKQTTPKDHIVAPITLKKGLTGAKPLAVCSWVLDLLNVQETDTVDDLFPGTGIMAEALGARQVGLR